MGDIFKERVESAQEHTCIIIDNLNILLSVYPQSEVLEFLQYCHVLVQNNPVPLPLPIYCGFRLSRIYCLLGQRKFCYFSTR